MSPGSISPRKWSLVLIFAIALVISACGSKPEPTTSQPGAHPAADNKIAVIETSAGTIKIELLASEAPKTAENFKELR
jgi:hypothetical protein